MSQTMLTARTQAAVPKSPTGEATVSSGRCCSRCWGRAESVRSVGYATRRASTDTLVTPYFWVALSARSETKR